METAGSADHSEDLRATWLQAIGTFAAPIFAVLAIRWLLFEPFVIPSESMVPNLLVHDHLVVNKTAYGLRNPFGNSFFFTWSLPKHSDIVVFKYPKNPDRYYIKRVIGLPGDRVRVEKGHVIVNDTPLEQQPTDTPPADAAEADFKYFKEGVLQYTIRYSDQDSQDFAEITVPAGQYFMMGDNRNFSSDSREWGFVPEANLVGRAAAIWLACDQMLATAPMLCDPQTLKWSRMFHGIN